MLLTRAHCLATAGWFLTQCNKGLPVRLSFPCTLPHILFWDQAAHPLARCISTSAETNTSTGRFSCMFFCSKYRGGGKHRPGDKSGQDKEHKLCHTGRSCLSTVCSPKPQGTSLAGLGHKKVHKPAVLLNRQLPATSHTVQL